jgi:hypothetical protein
MFTLDYFIDIITNCANGNKSEQAKHQFIEESHAKCHAIVLYEVDEEPIGDSYRLPQTHVRFYGNLDNLVNDEQNND